MKSRLNSIADSVADEWLRTAKKEEHEKEEEETERLVRDVPKKKPPRKDLHRRKVREFDRDTDMERVESDPDLSLNYKKVAKGVEFKDEAKAKKFFKNDYMKAYPNTKKTWKDFYTDSKEEAPAEEEEVVEEETTEEEAPVEGEETTEEEGDVVEEENTEEETQETEEEGQDAEEPAQEGEEAEETPQGSEVSQDVPGQEEGDEGSDVQEDDPQEVDTAEEPNQFENVMDRLQDQEFNKILDEPNPTVQKKMLKKVLEDYPDAKNDENYSQLIEDINNDIKTKRTKKRFRKTLNDLIETGTVSKEVEDLINEPEKFLGGKFGDTIKEFSKNLKKLNSKENVNTGVGRDKGYTRANRDQALEGFNQDKWSVALSDPKKNSKEIADLLSKAEFGRSKVFNPVNVSDVSVEDLIMDQNAGTKELNDHAVQSLSHYNNFDEGQRGEAFARISEKYDNSNNETEKKYLDSMKEGLAVSSLVKGDQKWPLDSKSEPAPAFKVLLKVLGDLGFTSEDMIESYRNPTSPQTRHKFYEALVSSPDAKVLPLAQGDEVLEDYASAIQDPEVDPSFKPFMRETLIESVLDDSMIWDYAVRDFLEQSGGEDVEISSDDIKKYSEDVKNTMGKIGPSLEQIEKMNENGESFTDIKNKIRLQRLEEMKGKLESDGMDLTKSSAGVALKDAVEKKDPSILKMSQKPAFNERLSSELIDQSSIYIDDISSVVRKNSTTLINENRRHSMSKLTKKGAANFTQAMDRIAQCLENDWDTLGLPKEAAMDVAYRLDLLSTTIEKTAACGEYGRLNDIPLSALKNEGQKPGTGNGGFDPGTISEVKPQGALKHDADEPYMAGHFTQRETAELDYRQENNKLNNSKCASTEMAREIMKKIAEFAAIAADESVEVEEEVEVKEEEPKEEPKEEKKEEKKANFSHGFNLFEE